ncbi:MAG TPA: gluconate 2-dehydrogenase subunit 3 family protein [Candidatus Sulfotelmatobacter sp.]
MQRREILRLLATGTALQLAPSKWLVFARGVRSLLAEAGSLRTLTPHQDATLKALADMIIPRTDTPAASDAGVSEFVDLVLTDWYEDLERAHFLDGLATVDSQSRALFQQNFIDCSTEQKGKLLTELGAKMLEGAVPGSRHRSVQRPAPPKTNFYADFRRLALTAYYTSEAGATQALHYEVIPEQYQGCNISPAKEPKQP